jgi:thymidylate kinase
MDRSLQNFHPGLTMRVEHGNKQTKFVSFSGIDGAGKSTQIRRFCLRIEQAGLSYSLVSFWDDVARFKGLRECASHVIFKGDRGIGSPSAPITRRDKNVRSWSMTLLRLCLYLADAISTRSLMEKARRSNVDVVILDRFIYDELANLELENPAMRTYARAIARVVPKPDISFLLDADPVAALARKPEYPLEFLQFNRKAYFVLNDLIGCMTIIPPLPMHEVESEILEHAETALSVTLAQDTIVQGLHLVQSARL